MKYKIVIITFVSILCLSCNDKNKNKKEVKLKLKKDTININIDSISMNYYTNFHTVKNIMYGYNSKTKNIDVFDLNNEKLKRHINLEMRGPNGLGGGVRGLYFHNSDSIFLMTSNRLLIINDQGIVKDKIKLHNAFKNNISFDPIVNDNFRLRYFHKEKQILIENLYPTNRIREYVDNSVVSILSLETRKAEFLPITFSKIFEKRKGYVGFLRWMNLESFKKDSLFFNSQFDDDLLIYNKRTRNISKIHLKERKFMVLYGI